MRTVKIHEAKTQFSKLLAEVEAGEEIIVQRGDVPIAKLVPLAPARRRVPGALKGQFSIPDDFKEIPPEFEEYLA